MPVVTMSAASQNGGLATVLIGSAAPTIPNLTINVLQLPLYVAFPLDLWPPSFSFLAIRANDRTVHYCTHRLLPRFCLLLPLVRERCSIP